MTPTDLSDPTAVLAGWVILVSVGALGFLKLCWWIGQQRRMRQIQRELHDYPKAVIHVGTPRNLDRADSIERERIVWDAITKGKR